MQTSIYKISSQRGFTLIEALVAFLVLSIGMLGMASLQTMSVKAGSTASQRSFAVVKVEEIVEHIRSNRAAIADYVSGTGGVGIDSGCNDFGGLPHSCNPTELAQYDVYQWKQALAEGGPSTQGSIVVNPPAVPNGLSSVVITVTWQELSAVAQAMENMSYSETIDICGAETC
ncbi:MAG: type IV pilus modification protein PilV [Gammaproteobacteria bacterium]